MFHKRRKRQTTLHFYCRWDVFMYNTSKYDDAIRCSVWFTCWHQQVDNIFVNLQFLGLCVRYVKRKTDVEILSGISYIIEYSIFFSYGYAIVTVQGKDAIKFLKQSLLIWLNSLNMLFESFILKSLTLVLKIVAFFFFFFNFWRIHPILSLEQQRNVIFLKVENEISF